jgi:hypothetical protein
MNKKVILWLFFVLMCGSIFTFSHQPATVSGNMSKNITAKIFEIIREC